MAVFMEEYGIVFLELAAHPTFSLYSCSYRYLKKYSHGPRWKQDVKMQLLKKYTKTLSDSQWRGSWWYSWIPHWHRWESNKITSEPTQAFELCFWMAKGEALMLTEQEIVLSDKNSFGRSQRARKKRVVRRGLNMEVDIEFQLITFENDSVCSSTQYFMGWFWVKQVREYSKEILSFLASPLTQLSLSDFKYEELGQCQTN